jgi:hypothetical protein
MRFEKADKLLQLAMELQARRQGTTVEEIQAHFSISRSTPLRMKSALEGLFPLEEAPMLEDRRKRWRIPPGTLDRMAGCTADELADLEMAIGLLRRENRREEADRLAGLGGKRDGLGEGMELGFLLEAEAEALHAAEQAPLGVANGGQLGDDRVCLPSELRPAFLLPDIRPNLRAGRGDCM